MIVISLISGVLVLRDNIRSRRESESEIEDGDQHHRRQRRILVQLYKDKFKTSEELYSEYQQAKASVAPLIIQSYDFKVFHSRHDACGSNESFIAR